MVDYTRAFREPPTIGGYGPSGPIWKNRAELIAIIREYAKWYAEGHGDREISRRIRVKWPPPPPRYFNKSKPKR